MTYAYVMTTVGCLTQSSFFCLLGLGWFAGDVLGHALVWALRRRAGN